MKSCSLPFFECEFKVGDTCPCAADKKGCMYDMLYGKESPVKEEHLELLVGDAYDWGYRLFRVERFLSWLNGSPIESEGIRARGVGGFIQLENKSQISLSKYSESNLFLPFLEGSVSDWDVGAVDLKRFKRSTYVKPSHAKQALGYSMSIAQEFGLTPKYFYPVVINRPFKRRPHNFRRFVWHILRIAANDPRVEYLKDELILSFNEQLKLYHDRDYFFERKEKYEYRRKCNGCFDQEFCDLVCKDLKERSGNLSDYFTDELQVIPNEFYLRWSEINKTCMISRIYSKVDKSKLPDHLIMPLMMLSIIGTTAHKIFNEQHVKAFYHNNTLRTLGLIPVPSDVYCEREVKYYIDDILVKGHADGLFMTGSKRSNVLRDSNGYILSSGLNSFVEDSKLVVRSTRMY